MPRHYGTRGRTGPRPRYLWVPARDVENTVASAIGQSDDLLGAYVADAARETGPHMTIERIIGTLTVEASTVGSGGDFTMGITMAPEGGFASVPAPQTEIHDWMVWVSGLFSDEASETAAGVFTAAQLVYKFDVRSRRRLRSIGEEIRAEVQNANAATLLWSLATRTLVRIGMG